MIYALRSRRALATGLLVGTACGASDVTVITPPALPSGDITLILLPIVEDMALAEALGWTRGIPGVTVVLTPTDSSAAPRTLVTDPDGRSVLDVVQGSYEVFATRWLSTEEQGRLPAQEGAMGWVARSKLQLNPGIELRLGMAASRRRSLVVNEWFYGDRVDPVTQSSYPWQGYIELYNNADTTTYLDGMVIGRGLGPTNDLPLFPCSLYTEYQNDPLGVWVIWSQRFPGMGRDYPISPGQLVLVATDAIDHAAIVVDGPDLRGADFEFSGSADVDNPAVPNMLDHGPTGFGFHGLSFGTNSGLLVLAMPVQMNDLPGAAVPGGTSNVMARVPRERVLDVVTQRTWTPPGTTPCARAVPSLIDREENQDFLSIASEPLRYTLSLHRRQIPPSGGGGRVLQHSRASSADFVVATRSPGQP